jgi:hypothetical protein
MSRRSHAFAPPSAAPRGSAFLCLALAILACHGGKPETADSAPADTGDSTEDSACPETWYRDADGDGYSGTEEAVAGCWPGPGWHAVADDCDDADPAVHPGAAETCDGRDEDCDCDVDEDVAVTWYPDLDADGWGDGTAPLAGSCEEPPGYVAVDGDCDDADPAVHPGAPEDPCDLVDQDCDGTPEGAALLDGVGYPLIQDAIDASIDGDEVEVCPGTWTEQLTIPTDLVLASFSGSATDTVLQPGCSGTMIEASGSTFEMRDLSLVDDCAGETGDLVAFWVPEVTISGCTFTTSAGGLAWNAPSVSAEGAREVTIEDCSFTSDGTEDAGAVDVEIRGAPFSLSLVDSVFSGFRDTEGGAVYVVPSCMDTISLSVDGCTFEDNHAVMEGGALSLNDALSSAVVSIEDSTFTGNEAGVGGAVALEVGGEISLDMDGSTFEDNLGDALHLLCLEGGTIRGQDLTFQGNGGSAVHVEGAPEGTVYEASLIDCSIEDGSTGEGAGLYFVSLDELTLGLTRTTIDGNTTSDEYSGALLLVDIADGTVAINDCAITSNSGGGLYLEEELDLTSTTSDWGTGATENDPYDVILVSEDGITRTTYTDFGASASFTCSGGTCY